jgi:CDP-diacylglycerol--glycerol-3-phosphate 3-phosphatidyltransferase
VITRVKDGARAAVRGALSPLVALLVRLGVKPDHVTWAGLAVTILGATWFAQGRFREGAVVAAIGCLMDGLDGAIARARDGVTKWGAFLDSTTDRVADAALFLGVAVHYAREPLRMLRSEDLTLDLQLGPPIVREAILQRAADDLMTAGAAIVALAGAYLVSYTRARSEGLGEECRVGWFERPERLVVLLGAGLFGAESPVMPWALVVLATLSFFTAFQRVLHVRKRLRAAV